jgi:hypothetical protein
MAITITITKCQRGKSEMHTRVPESAFGRNDLALPPLASYCRRPRRAA